MATANSTLALHRNTIANIRDALLIGLSSYSEIKRPTAASDTVSRFADALRALG